MAAHYDNQKVALLLLEKGASPHATAKVSSRLLPPPTRGDPAGGRPGPRLSHPAAGPLLGQARLPGVGAAAGQPLGATDRRGGVGNVRSMSRNPQGCGWADAGTGPPGGAGGALEVVTV